MQEHMFADRGRIEESLERGLDWIWSTRNVDFGWGRSLGQPSSMSNTCEILHSIVANKLRVERKAIDDSLAYLLSIYLNSELPWNRKYQSTKYHFWMALLFMETSHKEREKVLDRAYREMKLRRVEGGGWTCGQPIRANVYDTANALLVHSKAGKKNEEAASWLASVQNQDGGWGFFQAEKSNATCTALSILALNSHSVVDGPIRSGVAWLFEHQLGEGRWRLTYETGFGHADAYVYFSTPYVIRAFIESGVNPRSAPILKAVDYLLSVQLPTGGWSLLAEDNKFPFCREVQPLTHATAKALDTLAYYLLKTQ